MRRFHSLKVAAKQQETRDSVRIALDVPAELQPEFEFLPGQHLPIQIERDGKRLRRTYSICSESGRWPIEIGVRVQPGGQFSEYAANELSVGDELDVMPPNGQFHVNLDEGNSKFYLGFAAGSGITPILSIAKSVLLSEPASRFALFYGNRQQGTTMFIEDLYALKNRYPDRLQLHFVFSQEEQEFGIAAGRLDADKVVELHERFCKGDSPDEAYICGPDSMIATVTEALVELGMAADAVHAERFGAPRARVSMAPQDSAVSKDLAAVTVIMDGHKKSFDMPRHGESIVDAAAGNGVELPYSCKGGVCATCRTHLREGKVDMETNYGLEPWELEAGFVLACQSRPRSDAIVLDYDKS
ncbi:MAG: 2Fe-2S iron-sulfur cluster binding domain-containing protein [Gammaproteobacteria bacterium]|nr:2Fe-2S iron-sulfur cluster binding domain-containing protein [Gammaproteobacteria bacterium]MBT8111869.1 2Fe-2S iron-sulfur cluster binding domain-containing protein [Gammaproteobacteria bacterium]NND46904.1 2Fe-2S iron-sulfur cluster binding domain-containing protein [Woeseiaceae bacterium]NNL46568.1 2Fe-2S iron-sulfur cluster binding domain-containing protein [Woeseiaceae bacterium]